MSLGSMLGRISGLDPGHKGVMHWWAQRLSAAALVPLVVWFVASVVGLAGASHGAVVAWLSQPLAATLMVVLVVVGFHHTQLGLQAVIEDYIAEGPARCGVTNTMRALVLLAALGALVAVASIAWAG